jgi:hypothetical protein
MAAKPLLIRLSIGQGQSKPAIIHSLLTPKIEGNRDASISITGGGVVVAVDQKGAQVVPAVTGGGVVNVIGRKGATAAVTLTGGGDILLTSTKNAKLNVSLTGGGIVLIQSTDSRMTSQQITGGGDVTIQTSGDHSASISITGGGVVTVSAAQPEAVIVVQFDMMEEGSGVGPSAKRRQGQTPFDDWTRVTDDEMVLEYYLLRKTR